MELRTVHVIDWRGKGGKTMTEFKRRGKGRLKRRTYWPLLRSEVHKIIRQGQQIEKEYIQAKTLALITGKAVRTIYWHIMKGYLYYNKAGGYGIHIKDVANYLDSYYRRNKYTGKLVFYTPGVEKRNTAFYMKFVHKK